MSDEAQCVHHWIVATVPDGDMLTGACRRCGSQRLFPAALNYRRGLPVKGAAASQQRRAQIARLQAIEADMESAADD